MENPRPRRLSESLERPEGTPTAARRAGAPRVLVLLGGACVLLLAGGAGWVLHHQRSNDLVNLPRPGPSKEDRPSQLFRQAKQQILAFEWREAQATLRELQATAPDHPLVKDYLDRVAQEILNQEHLKGAEAALREQMLIAAKKELDAISPTTSMFEKVTELKRALRNAADQQVVYAREMLSSGQKNSGLLLLERVLAVFPDHPEALALRAAN